MQTNGQGKRGIIVYVAVGILLTALLGGSIYFSKQQGRVASRSDTVATNDAPAESANDTAAESLPQDTARDDDRNEDRTPAAPAPTTPQPARPAPQPSQPARPQQPQPAPGRGSGTADTNTQSTNVPSTGPSQIASTGPAETAASVVVVSLLAFGGVAYHRSRGAVRAKALGR